MANNSGCWGQKIINRGTLELKKLPKDHKNISLEPYLRNLTPIVAKEYFLWRASKKFNHAPFTIHLYVRRIYNRPKAVTPRERFSRDPTEEI